MEVRTPIGQGRKTWHPWANAPGFSSDKPRWYKPKWYSLSDCDSDSNCGSLADVNIHGTNPLSNSDDSIVGQPIRRRFDGISPSESTWQAYNRTYPEHIPLKPYYTKGRCGRYGARVARTPCIADSKDYPIEEKTKYSDRLLDIQIKTVLILICTIISGLIAFM